MPKHSNNDYNPRLKMYARELRKNSTKAEIIVWSQLLKGRKMKGVRFLRQRPILNYIADFFCKDLKLVIEIDGWTHEDVEVQEKDRIKEQNLIDAGYHVIRFTDYEVRYHLDEVKFKIEKWIENYSK